MVSHCCFTCLSLVCYSKSPHIENRSDSLYPVHAFSSSCMYRPWALRIFFTPPPMSILVFHFMFPPLPTCRSSLSTFPYLCKEWQCMEEVWYIHTFERTDQGVLTWFGHKERMSKEIPTKRVSLSELETKMMEMWRKVGSWVSEPEWSRKSAWDSLKWIVMAYRGYFSVSRLH